LCGCIDVFLFLPAAFTPGITAIPGTIGFLPLLQLFNRFSYDLIVSLKAATKTTLERQSRLEHSGRPPWISFQFVIPAPIAALRIYQVFLCIPQHIVILDISLTGCNHLQDGGHGIVRGPISLPDHTPVSFLLLGACEPCECSFDLRCIRIAAHDGFHGKGRYGWKFLMLLPHCGPYIFPIPTF